MPTIKQKKQTEDRKKTAYDFYINKGYSPEQSSAIVGNLLKESGLKTSAEGDVGYSGGSSFGIAQWREGRLDKLKKMYGKNWQDFNNQLEFVDWELNNTEKAAGDALRNSKTLAEAGQAFSDKYERPKTKFHQDKQRQEYVNTVYKTFIGSPQQQITTDVNNFAIALNTPIFAGVPDVSTKENKETVKEDKDVKELEQKTNEYNFLQEVQNSSERALAQEEQQPQQQQRIQPQSQNYLQQYEQVSQFVDSPFAQQGGKFSENEIAFLSDIAVKDNNGYWNKNNHGKIVEIQGSDITMKNVNQPLVGLADTGEKKIMCPNKDYNFKGAKKVIEIPFYKNK